MGFGSWCWCLCSHDLFSRLNTVFKIGGLVLAIGLAVTFRIFDAKFWGVAVMGGAVLILFLLPWLDRSGEVY